MSIAQKLNIARTVKITPTLTASDWQLYTVSSSCSDAAIALNATLVESVNSGMTRREVESKMSETMGKYAQFGACDSEPRGVLDAVLDQLFPDTRD